MTMREAAPAKVNLYLHVTGRRADGYHLLDSLVVFGAAADALEAAPASGLSLALEGPFAAGLQAEADNLVLRATELRPQDGNIADSLGWVMFRLGNLPEAVTWLEKSVELEPRNSVINDHLGDAYWAAGRQREAQFQWRRALTMEPEPAEIAKIEGKLKDGLPGYPAPTAQR